MARKNKELNHVHVGFLAVASIILAALFITQSYNLSYSKGKPETTGKDEFGYNYAANLFSGPADGVDRVLDGKVWGDSTYANDRLVMKWSKAWNDARFGGEPWTCDAWTSNEWNGKVPGGSGETWHYKIVWVGSDGQNSDCWRDGGYSVWGDFEVIFSQGTTGNAHFWDVHANPPGYGGF